MELFDIQKTDVPLLSRTEIKAKIKFKGKTPSRDELRKDLINTLKCKDKLVVVRKITTKFGGEEGDLLAYVYKDEKSLNSLEPKYSRQRNFKVKKKEDAPADEKAEAKPEGDAKPDEKPAENKANTSKTEKKAPADKPDEKKEEKAKNDKSE